MSSLIDLQAELSKKEEEWKRKKTSSKMKGGGEKKSKTFEKLREMTSKKKKKKNKVGDWKEEGETTTTKKVTSDEFDELYAKSQQMLLAKSKIYDKMEKGEMEDFEDIYGDTRYLVDFEQKTFDQPPSSSSSSSSSKTSSALTATSSSQIAAENIYDANEEYREKLQEKWRKEQEDILNAPVHYENIKFDEVRELGTGYYAFSKNEEERQKQMEELKNLRQETISVQKKKEALQNKRKAALEARLMKVKRRKAADEGRLEEFLEQCEKEKQEAAAKAEQVVDESETDAMLSALRQQTSKQSAIHQDPREWDQGKNESGFVAAQAFVKADKNNEPRKANTVDDTATNAVLSGLRQSSKQQTPTTSRDNREWDKGKSESGFLASQQKFVNNTSKLKTSSSYEQRIQQVRKERPDEFAPPNFY